MAMSTPKAALQAPIVLPRVPQADPAFPRRFLTGRFKVHRARPAARGFVQPAPFRNPRPAGR